MADRYWVGGTGTWDGASTTNWSAATGKSITASCATTTLTVTAGVVVVGDTVWSNNHTSLGTITANLGGGNWTVSIGGTFASQAMSAATVGASVPGAADSVFFDANSNSGTTAFTVTMATTPRLCNDFTASGLDGVMTLAGSAIGLTVSGSLTFPATNFTRTYTGTTTFNATTTGKTITTNGVAFGGTVTLNGIGGAWTLGSAFSCGGDILTLTAGTFNTSASNYAVTAASFSSSGTGTRTITLNASTLTFSSSLLTAWAMTTSTNATLNAGTSTINLSGSGATFAGGGLTYYNVSFTSTIATTSVKSITGVNTFTNLTFSTIAAAGLNNISLSANQTINGTLTISGANGNQRQFVQSNTITTPRTLTCATIAAMADVDFQDITIAGAHGTLSGTRLGDCGGNSNITFVAGKTVYWSLVGGGNWNANGWAPGSGGTPTTTNYPLPQDTAVIENTGLNTSATITINGAWNISSLDTSTRTNAMTLASGTTTPTFYGNFTYGSGVTPTGTGTYTFSNRATKTLNSGGKTFTQPVEIIAPGGGIQLLTNNLTLGATLTTTLTQGTLDLNNLTLTTGSFSSNNSNTRSIAFGTTGSVVVNTASAGFTVLNMSIATNFTFTGTSNISAAMSVTRTFNFGPTGATTANRLNINLTSGASAPSFIGSFRQINFTGTTSNLGNQTISCHGFTLASGGTYTNVNFLTVGDGTLTSTGKGIQSLEIVGGSTTTLNDACLITGGTSTEVLTLTIGTLNLNNFGLTTPALISNNGFSRSIAFGTSGSITLSGNGAGALELDMGIADNFTITGTSNITAASISGNQFEFGNIGGATTANRLNINLTSGAGQPTFTGSFRQINFTGSTGTINQTISCHGFTLASGGTYTSATFITVGDGTLTYTGKAISTLNVNGTGITTTLASAGQNATTTLTNGTLDLAGFTLTSTTTAATGTGTKNLTFNGGTLICSAASTTAWNNANPTGFTTTAGTGTGTISMTAATAKTFVGGGSIYNCTLNQGGAGTLTITGANTFNDITETVPTANQITFPASTTTTVNAFTLSGTVGNLVSIRSSTPATQFTLSDPSGTVSVSYLNIQDSNATGGAVWQAYTINGNVNSGNNLGWRFAPPYDVSVNEFTSGLDAISLLLTRIGAVSETTRASEADSATLTRIGAVSETTRASEADSATLTRIGAVSETTQASEADSATLTRIGAVSETTQASEVQQGNIITSRAVSETTQASDADSAVLAYIAEVSETTQASDANSAGFIYIGAVSETTQANDANSTTLIGISVVSENTRAADSVIGNVSLQLFIGETAIAQALAGGTKITNVQISETVTAQELIASIAKINAQINEGAIVLDEISARYIWELINNNQLPGWQLIPNDQGSGWIAINTNTGTSWTDIDTF